MYLDDVPPAGQPLDPLAFFGLRFRSEYWAHDVSVPSMALGSLNTSYRAHLLYWGSGDLDETTIEARRQRRQWSRLANQVFIPTDASSATAKKEVLAALDDPEPKPISVLYLYCQASVGEGNDPVLRFGPASDDPADNILRTDFATKPFRDKPLVFANACSTAAGDPSIANELEAGFFERKCSAYLGTEGKVPIQLASRFATIFFHCFYGEVEGPMFAGEAVAQTRLFLWTHYRNLGGLFYTYVNAYELYLAGDEEVRSLRP
jgi:hypothetical protein